MCVVRGLSAKVTCDLLVKQRDGGQTVDDVDHLEIGLAVAGFRQENRGLVKRKLLNATVHVQIIVVL